MADNGVRFIHKDGRVIPIHTGTSGRRVSAVKAAVTHSPLKNAQHLHKQITRLRGEGPVKGNKFLKAASLGISVAEGAATGLLLGHGSLKANIIGNAIGEAANIGAVGLAAAAYTGKGHTKERTIAAAKQEAINQIAGWTAFAGAALGSSAGRARLAQGAKTAAEYTSKIFKMGKKALNLVD